MRVFALSDLHVDHAPNWNWVEQLSFTEYVRDLLILAGDVTHRMDLLARTFDALLRKFRFVFFVPGNHELWVHQDREKDSLEKYVSVMRLCNSLGVRTEAACLSTAGGPVSIIPLFSWYTKPEEGADTLFVSRDQEDDPQLHGWADSHLVKWPRPEGLTPNQYFLALNDERISKTYAGERISFSHFLPKRELMFRSADEPTRPNRNPSDFNFSRVAGSTLLDRQIRRLGATIHVYGHQHRNRRRYHDGVWYVSSCLGYPDERRKEIIDAASIPMPLWPPHEAVFPR